MGSLFILFFPPLILTVSFKHAFLKNMTPTEALGTVKDLIDKYLKVKQQNAAKREKENEEFASPGGQKGRSVPPLDLRFTTLSESGETPSQQWKQDKQKIKEEKERDKEEKEKDKEEVEKAKKELPEKKAFTFDTLSDTLDEDDEDAFRAAIIQQGGKGSAPPTPQSQNSKPVSPAGSDIVGEQEKTGEYSKKDEKKEIPLDRTSSVYLWQNYTKGAEKLLAQSHDLSAESPSVTDDDSETLTESGSDGSDIISDWHDALKYRAAGRGKAVASGGEDVKDIGSGTLIFFNTMSAGAQKAVDESSELPKTRSLIEQLRDGTSRSDQTIPTYLQKSKSKPEMPSLHADAISSSLKKSKKHKKHSSRKGKRHR